MGAFYLKVFDWRVGDSAVGILLFNTVYSYKIMLFKELLNYLRKPTKWKNITQRLDIIRRLF